MAGAPGWTATDLSVAAQEARGVTVSSDTRGGAPFHPLLPDGRASRTVEVPSTLPTLDELLALDEYGESAAARERTVRLLVEAVTREGGLHVHSVHTEIEGGKALHPLFARQLAAWKEAGVAFVTLGGAAAELVCAGAALPARPLAFTTLPGRATPVASGW